MMGRLLCFLLKLLSVSICTTAQQLQYDNERSLMRGYGNFRGRGNGRGRGCNAFGLVAVESTKSFNQTCQDLASALNSNPNIRLLAQVPHSTAAATVGLELLPNEVFVFGNPNLGTPIMEANREVGIDLPQKMLVWENSQGLVFVGYNSPEYLKFRHAGIEDVATLDTIRGALKKFASDATGVSVEDIKDRPPANVYRSRRPSGVVTTLSDSDFETTWNRLIATIQASPANIAFEVDHSANSDGILLPTRLVVFGNPNLGTPVMQASASAGIDLPLKILVWESENGQTQVTTNAIAFLKKRHRLRSLSLDSIEGAIANFVRVATEG